VHGVAYLPGFVGLNNLSRTDYVNVTLHALSHVAPLRTFFLDRSRYATSKCPIVHKFGEVGVHYFYSLHFLVKFQDLTSLHISLYFTLLHFTSLHLSLHFTSLHFTSLHLSLHFTSPLTLLHFTSQFTSLLISPLNLHISLWFRLCVNYGRVITSRALFRLRNFFR
jgi:hypothetical protein